MTKREMLEILKNSLNDGSADIHVALPLELEDTGQVIGQVRMVMVPTKKDPNRAYTFMLQSSHEPGSDYAYVRIMCLNDLQCTVIVRVSKKTSGWTLQDATYEKQSEIFRDVREIILGEHGIKIL